MTLSFYDLEQVDHLVRTICRGEMLPRFGQITANEINTKMAVDDLVTIVDTAVEKALCDGLRRLFPTATIIGEESISRDFDYNADPLLFVIDPLDGTWNYAKGLPVFGCIISILSHGRTIGGLMHYPLHRDSFLSRVGNGVAVIDASGSETWLPSLRDGGDLISGMVPFSQFAPAKRGGVMQALQDIPRLVSVQCSVYEYRMLLKGEVDFILSTGLQRWDHAAGQLMLEELGGWSHCTSGRYWPQVQFEDVMVSARGKWVVDEITTRMSASLGELSNLPFNALVGLDHA